MKLGLLFLKSSSARSFFILVAMNFYSNILFCWHLLTMFLLNLLDDPYKSYSLSRNYAMAQRNVRPNCSKSQKKQLLNYTNVQD